MLRAGTPAIALQSQKEGSSPYDEHLNSMTQSRYYLSRTVEGSYTQPTTSAKKRKLENFKGLNSPMERNFAQGMGYSYNSLLQSISLY